MQTLSGSSLDTEAALVRALGVRQLTAATVNATVGAGIFVLPALVAQGMGAAAPLTFLICAAIMGLIATTLALAGSRVAVTGGIYAYVEVAFGPFVGFLAGVLQWLTGVLSGVSTALLDQIMTLAPALDHVIVRVATLGAVLGALAAVNVRGVQWGTCVIESATAVKLVPLLALVGVGVFFIDPAAIVWPGLPDVDAVGRSVLVLIFAYSGAELAIAPSGEVKNPALAPAVPRARSRDPRQSPRSAWIGGVDPRRPRDRRPAPRPLYVPSGRAASCGGRPVSISVFIRTRSASRLLFGSTPNAAATPCPSQPPGGL